MSLAPCPPFSPKRRNSHSHSELSNVSDVYKEIPSAENSLPEEKDKKPKEARERSNSQSINSPRHRTESHEEEIKGKSVPLMGQSVPKGKDEEVKRRCGTGCRQMCSLFRKNWIIKRRSWCQTLCEFLLPILIAVGLVFAFRLSQRSVVTTDDTTYHQNTLDFNGVINAAIQSATGGNVNVAIRRLASTLFSYKGPLPIIPFDSYVALSKAIQLGLRQAGAQDVNQALRLLSLVSNQYDNLIYLGTLSFAPNTPAVRAMVDYFRSKYTYFNDVFDKIYESEGEAVDHALELTTRDDALLLPYSGRTWAIFSFEKLDLENSQIYYTLRLNYTVIPSTKVKINKLTVSYDGSHQKYYYSGFLSLQNMVEEYVLNATVTRTGLSANGGNTLRYKPEFTAVAMPVTAATTNPFFTRSGPFVGLVLCMAMLYPVSRLMKSLVEEKETRTKETMRMMGMLNWPFLLSHFLTYFIVFTAIAIISSLLMTASILSNTSITFVFPFFFFFNCSMLTLGFMISTFFDRSKLAGIVGPIMVFALVMPKYAFITADPTDLVNYKYLSCLAAPSAFAFGFDLFTQYEAINQGVTAVTASEDPVSYNGILAFLILDFFLYGFFFLYFEQVMPNEYGTNRPPWFLFMPSYWCTNNRKGHLHLDNGHPLDDDDAVPYELSAENEEKVQSADLLSKLRIRIQSLYRQFTYGAGPTKRTVTAVNNLCLDFYEGQITALLGHNGAGKSTTISILTGLIPPTSGDCLIDGFSVRDQMDSIRLSLGVCPQHNVLFDLLTVKEHLELFANLKGMKKEDIPAAVTALIKDVGLVEKTDVISRSLSGGMKRKLSVAIALIGDSKVVFLDEPTSGMDPYSRRSTWELLKRYKKDRVIVLTTHFMDEADLLGDRIAIMAHGKLRCVGSSLFLKSRYGVGYNLTLALQPGVHDSGNARQLELLSSVVHEFVPDAKLLSHAGAEVSYQLPLGSVAMFADLFDQIDSRKAQLGVEGYGISMTTLEEVFMKIAQEGETDYAKAPALKNSSLFALGGSKPLQLAQPQLLSHEGVALGFRALNASATPSPITTSAATATAGSPGPVVTVTEPETLEHKEPAESTSGALGDSSTALNSSPSPLPQAQLTQGAPFDSPQRQLSSGLMPPSLTDERSHGADSTNTTSKSDAPLPLHTNGKVNINNIKAQSNHLPAGMPLQIRELLLKRIYCAVRDPKGRFCEIILPVLVVAAVLAILLININISGPPIRLDSQLFNTDDFASPFPANVSMVTDEKTIGRGRCNTPIATDRMDNPLLYYVGNVNPAPWVRMPVMQTVNYPNIDNSANMSTKLLSTAKKHGGSRVGAFIPYDTYPYQSFRPTITTATLLDLLQNIAGTNFTLSFNNIRFTIPAFQLVNGTIVFPSVPTGSFLFFRNSTLRVELGNQTLDLGITSLTYLNSVLQVNTTSGSLTFSVAQTTINGILNTLNNLGVFNVSTLNTTVNQFNLNFTNLNLTDVSVFIDARNITFRINGADFSFNVPDNIAVALTAGNLTISLPDLANFINNSTFFSDFLGRFLPTLQTPMTIVHNTSSAHAIPAFAAELFRARLQLLRSSLVSLSPTVSLDQANGAQSQSPAPTAAYVLWNNPMPATAAKTLQIQTLLSVLSAILTIIPFCYLPASFVIFIVKERSVKAKHLQLVSGVHPLAYWISTYLFDILQYLVILTLVMCMFFAFDNSNFVGTSQAAGATFLLFFLYGLAVIPMSYCLSLLFTSHSSAQIAIAAIHFLLGFGLTITSTILDQLEDTQDANESLKDLYRLFPPYNFGEGMIAMSARALYALFLGRSPDPYNWEVLGRNLVYLVCEAIFFFGLVVALEYSLFSKVAEPFLRWLDVRVTRWLASREAKSKSDAEKRHVPLPSTAEMGVVSSNKVKPLASSSAEDEKTPDLEAPVPAARPAFVTPRAAGEERKSQSEDSDETGTGAEAEPSVSGLYPDDINETDGEEDIDVKRERHRVQRGRADGELIQIERLSKAFGNNPIMQLLRLMGFKLQPPKKAVRELYLGVPAGECFGFLGVNGAGKTTTMSILTGDFGPTSGTAKINGFDVVTQQEYVRRELGYCPQFDPLLDLMTAREHLYMYARIRGIQNAKEVVEGLIEHLGLIKYADNVSESYSGGTKRKLSLALALIGDPTVIFLDEPSTGMDPVSRRFMWDVISGISQRMSVVLTTHSMEECEALCQRIGIMVQGKLKCLGSVQHLKNRFGQGYLAEINTLDEHVDGVVARMAVLFPGTILLEQHAGRMKFQLPQRDLNLAAVFRVLQNVKEELHIRDYSISQSSLEQIFVGIARQQEQREEQAAQIHAGAPVTAAQ